MKSTLLCALLLLSTTAVLAAEREAIKPVAQERQFLLVLTLGTDEEPDLAAYGATLEHRWLNRVLIRISDENARELSKHPRVHYLQALLKPGETSGYVPAPAGPQAPFDRIAAEAVTNPVWNSGDYKYDGSGNIINIGGDYYVYDQLGRLTRASLTGTSARDEYKYDSFTNLVERGTSLGGGWSVQTIAADGGNNRLSGATYDGVGDFKSGAGSPYSYAYDPFRMIAQQSGSGRADHYVYDAEDERVATFNDSTDTWVWTVRDDDGAIVRQYESPAIAPSTWVWIEDFVRGLGGLAGSERVAAEGGRRHFHADHLGTTRMVTNHSGQAISRHDFTPYGIEITSISQEMERGYDRPNIVVFTGHERDFNGGTSSQNSEYLDYMHARYYKGALGRFLTVDPSAEAVMIERSASWNRYSYGQGNPIASLDPNGAILIFATGKGREYYEEYLKNLDPNSQDYKNAKQLEASDITYVISVEGLEGKKEGEVTFDGQNVILNLDSGGPTEDASMQSRLAHEIEHGVQVDNGALGFKKLPNGKWEVTFTDIQDEIQAWTAQQRQATDRDWHHGNLRDFANAKDKADALIRRGYGQYAKRKHEVAFAPKIPGYAPGAVFRHANWFYRIRP
jgi:RHS repeat-associated protein